jgi:hypothetical protein
MRVVLVVVVEMVWERLSERGLNVVQWSLGSSFPSFKDVYEHMVIYLLC